MIFSFYYYVHILKPAGIYHKKLSTMYRCLTGIILANWRAYCGSTWLFQKRYDIGLSCLCIMRASRRIFSSLFAVSTEYVWGEPLKASRDCICFKSPSLMIFSSNPSSFRACKDGNGIFVGVFRGDLLARFCMEKERKTSFFSQYSLTSWFWIGVYRRAPGFTIPSLFLSMLRLVFPRTCVCSRVIEVMKQPIGLWKIFVPSYVPRDLLLRLHNLLFHRKNRVPWRRPVFRKREKYIIFLTLVGRPSHNMYLVFL